MTKKNLDLWNKHSKTDLDHTKQVEFGRKFTAIDAHSQIMNMTEEFGPMGKGWSAFPRSVAYPPNDTVAIEVVLWHESKEQEIVQFGQKKLKDSKGKPDEDAFKKAFTDGLTKCISYLGFNADVFLGKFDDNKYIEDLKKDKKKKEKLKGPLQRTELDKRLRVYLKDALASTSMDEFNSANEEYKAEIKQANEQWTEYFTDIYEEQTKSYKHQIRDHVAKIKKDEAMFEQQKKESGFKDDGVDDTGSQDVVDDDEFVNPFQ